MCDSLVNKYMRIEVAINSAKRGDLEMLKLMYINGLYNPNDTSWVLIHAIANKDTKMIKWLKDLGCSHMEMFKDIINEHIFFIRNERANLNLTCII